MQVFLLTISTDDVYLRCGEKVFVFFLISFSFLRNICHTYMFQIIKLLLILDKDNQSKHKILFLNVDFHF